ncbi:Protein of unknown function [Muriicola jejuensis]|uniref:DUF2971 domain-containing protein n=1 Tax=Muriicola jejuensis TaxID=504488 RepID=A0A6P0UIG7_9FLAO|nr:DUF2971 domain-containing protein [Muriicola jejuensis]NER09986.1 DUF2971 domain-containing protein [Muriicola jejuensis]SMP04053.1 Protein of unknown function [Muriicola jejuensis]
MIDFAKKYGVSFWLEKNKVDFPKTLFKYRTWSNQFHRYFISNREVFFASPTSFEDDLDCKSPPRYDLLSKNEILELFEDYSHRRNPHFSPTQHLEFINELRENSPLNDPIKVKEWMSHYNEKYFEREGIFSLTANYNNNQMWTKYSENNKGFCVAYDSEVLFNYLGGGGAVKYVEKLPIVKPRPFMSLDEAFFIRVFHKTNEWKFEQEYRAIKFLKDNETQADRKVTLPQNAIIAIILGDKMPPKFEEELRGSVKSNIGDVEILRRNQVNLNSFN